MKPIYATDISERKEFTFQGDKLKQLRCANEEQHIYVYERYNSAGRLYAYEVVRGKRRKNPDGNIVYVYPTTEDFNSSHGFFIALAHKDNPKYGVDACIARLEGTYTGQD